MFVEYAQTSSAIPKSFPVAVVIKHRRAPEQQVWRGDSWQVSGVMVNSQPVAKTAAGILLRSSSDGDDYLWGGFSVQLHKDEVESYYHNLMSSKPRLFVVSTSNEQGVLVPFMVSASFDEAHAYFESDLQTVPIPPELYPWIEQYVLAHYVPEQKMKRKRRSWTDNDPETR
jgi:hypothetical protein